MPILKGKKAIAVALKATRRRRKYAEGGHTEEEKHRSGPLSLKQVRAQIAKTGEIPDIDSLPRGLVDTVIASILHGAKTGFVTPGHALGSKEPIPTEHMLSPSRDMAAVAIGASKAAAIAKEIKKNLATYTSETLGPQVRETALPDDQVPVPDDKAVAPPVSFAGGGNVGNFNPERGAAFGLAKQGMIKSDVPGRTDKLNLNVPSGSYIIPADIPSALGQGNSDAGNSILSKMMNRGPYGMALGRAKAGSRIGPRKASLMKMKGFADGGGTEVTPIVAAGGEWVVHPETVASFGNGDIDLGHSILDAFVKQIRQKHISTLRKLPGPKGSD